MRCWRPNAILGADPTEMPPNNKGYDIESRDADGSLLFIEVKGGSAGAETFTVTRSEIGVGAQQARPAHPGPRRGRPLAAFPTVR